ncbi:hypothetical protein [Anaeromassilibacillus senegalensis]|uniref:hypothetical protein n=1 Tax=Anaeromassilibacillus senegalensis TaxID=1673717 RepID=UPI0006826383|nr:hypothetical protein [Anaeromassilibacillus senegalensis]
MEPESMAVQALESAKSAHHRLDRLEVEVKDIHDLAAAMAATRQEITGVQEDIREIKKNVTELTKRPAAWWDKLIAAAIGAVATGIVGAVLALIFK